MAGRAVSSRVRAGDVRVMPDGRRVRVMDIYVEHHPTRQLVANLIGDADRRPFTQACAAVQNYPKINPAHGGVGDNDGK